MDQGTTRIGVACAMPIYLGPKPMKIKNTFTCKNLPCAALCLPMANIRPGQYCTMRFEMGVMPNALARHRSRYGNYFH
jgi:hypothetical protein